VTRKTIKPQYTNCSNHIPRPCKYCWPNCNDRKS